MEKNSFSINDFIEKETQVEIFNIPGYEAIKEVGRGGMGIVYKGFNKQTKRWEAIKTFKREKILGKKRFQREMSVLQQLSHPNIVKLYSSPLENGCENYFMMEYVEGITVETIIKKGAIEQRQAAHIILEVVKGLKCAHKNDIIHRDIKPSNIMITQNNEVKIMDFGLAKSMKLSREAMSLTRCGELFGTPNYMAPEHINGKSKKVSDIYSVGATLYEMLTKIPPYQGNDLIDIFTQILAKNPTKPSEINSTIEKDLEKICLKCLQKDEKKRYQTIDELERDLIKYLESEKEKKVFTLSKGIARFKNYILLIALIFSIILLTISLLYRPTSLEKNTPKKVIQALIKLLDKESLSSKEKNILYNS